MPDSVGTFTWATEQIYRATFEANTYGIVIWPSYKSWEKWWKVRAAPINYEDWTFRMEPPWIMPPGPR